MTRLQTELNQHQAVEKTVIEDGKLYVYLNANLDAAELNLYLANKGIVLSHLVKRKYSLEEQFLQLTNHQTN